MEAESHHDNDIANAPDETHVAWDPVRPGRARAILTHYGVPIWALIGWWRGTDDDIERVAREYHISVAAMRAAIEYYNEPFNRVAIDELIAINNSDSFGS